MKLLVSLCNKRKLENVELPDCFLFEICPQEPVTIKPVFLNHSDIVSPGGFTGLVRFREGIVVLTQSDQPQAVYCGLDYEVRQVWDLEQAVDPHTVIVHDEKLYMAATGRDAIMEYEPGRDEHIYWQDNTKGKDTIHLNSLLMFEERMLATAFGRKRDKMWRSLNTVTYSRWTRERSCSSRYIIPTP